MPKPIKVEDFERAITSNDLKLVWRFLAEGFNPDTKCQNGWPMLILAIENASREMVEMLLEAGSSPNAKNPEGNTALHAAMALGSANKIEAVLAKRPIINASNNEKNTPLNLAIVHGRHYSLIERLIDKGADINWVNRDGETPTQIAKRLGRKKITRLLEAHKDAQLTKTAV